MSRAPPKTRISNEQYNLLANRRQAFDALLWQTPVLSLTAQAFLFTIALSDGNTVVARAISAMLALIVALASLQLMAKHRYHEKACSLLLQIHEEANDLHPVHSGSTGGKRPFYLRLSSYLVWMATLWGFAFAAALVLLSVIRGYEWF